MATHSSILAWRIPVDRGAWRATVHGVLKARMLKYIMGNARQDDAQTGIKIARRDINNLRYADDTILMAESKEELKSFLMSVKGERERASLKLNIK